MSKRIDIIYEMVFFIRRMPENDKNSFKLFLKRKRNGIQLIKMLKAFEKCDPDSEAKGLIKRLIVIQKGKDYRLFLKFKSCLFDYEISTKRTNYFKYEDHQSMLFIELKKSFLAAQMMTEKDAYLTSIESMKDTYQKAKKYELLEIQKDCSENLADYYRHTGNIEGVEYWQNESKSLNTIILTYQSIHNIFEKKLHKILCCYHHNLKTKFNQNTSEQTEIRTIQWMVSILFIHESKHTLNPRQSFKEILTLYREFESNPGLFPLHFKVAVIKLMLEELYRLGKTNLLSRYAKKIYLLDFFPVYRRIPLMHFFLYFLLKSKNYRILDLVIEDINKEQAYQHFQPFIDQFKKINLLYMLAKGEYKKAMRSINRNKKNTKCVHYNFEIRLIELMCLYMEGHSIVTFDKLESLRRYVYRNEELRKSPNSLVLFKSVKSLILGQRIENYLTQTNSSDSIYDLHDIMMSMIISLGLKPVYASRETYMQLAAEPGIPNQK